MASPHLLAQAPDAKPSPAPGAPSSPDAPNAPASQGQILIQSHGDPPPAPGEPGYPAAVNTTPMGQQALANDTATADLTDAERSALLITGYDLDARINPTRSGLNMRAQLTVRNTGGAPLKQLALQISSTLHWESATLVQGPQRTRLALAQYTLDTDADHTGAENEAILPLPEPLAPGAIASLDLFYSGTVAGSTGRLARLGANASQSESTDWDTISTVWTGLRGFGNVLWYPVASPQLFLADGNALFAAIGHTRLLERDARMHLRLAVEYTGNAPAAAYFSGRRQDLKAFADDPDAPVETGSGVARAEFPAEPLGFRTPSLFLLAVPETFPGSSTAAPSADDTASSSSSSAKTPADPPSTAENVTTESTPAVSADSTPGPPFLAVESVDPGSTAGFVAAANHVAPLLREWLGSRPLSALTAIDFYGQPYGDGPLLVGPLAVLGTSGEGGTLIQSLTHAWVQTGQPWMDEGLGEFFGLLWTERERGRATANAQLGELMRPVTLAEPEPAAGASVAPGQPLVEAADDLFYRRKAGAVWWMLRGIVGDGALHQALAAWRTQPASAAPATEQAIAFQHLLEKLSGKDLGWFFSDWVLRDRGLPDLTLTDVAAVQEPASPGHAAGWLVAVTVRNEGAAVADVPVSVFSGSAHNESRVRVPGFSTVTQRVLVEAPPTQVSVNDGGTPEVRSATHTREIKLQVR